eukprot:764627_1
MGNWANYELSESEDDGHEQAQCESVAGVVPTNDAVESPEPNQFQSEIKQDIEDDGDWNVKHDWKPDIIKSSKPIKSTFVTRNSDEDNDAAHNNTGDTIDDSPVSSDDDEDSKQEDRPQCCMLVIGTTGSGKSRTCQLLTGRDVPSGHGPESKTRHTTMYESTYDPNMRFVDTMGTQDSQKQYTDGEILKQSLQYLHKEKINISKVIWCLASGDQRRSTVALKDEAEFINGLKGHITDEGKEDDALSVWDSVLIVKQGEGNMTGPIQAAQSVEPAYNQDDAHIFRYTCKEWLKQVVKVPVRKKCKEMSDDAYANLVKLYDEIDRAREVELKKLKYIPEAAHEECGFYTKERAREIIIDMLKSLPFFKFEFRKEKCTKCGCKGDSRYVDAPSCHTEPEWLHTSPIIRFHPGELITFHRMGIGSIPVEYSHDPNGTLVRLHKTNTLSLYHPGKQKIVNVKKEVDGICYIFDSLYEEEDYVYWEWQCCKASSESCGKTKAILIHGCDKKWDCCDQHWSVKQCTANEETWSCCNAGESDPGCIKTENKHLAKYECCDKVFCKDQSNGCMQKYDCCDTNGEECEAYYPCCNKKKDNGIEPKGCEEKCKDCKHPWGKPGQNGTDSGCRLVVRQIEVIIEM